jgi:periplasmic copper chaperone A
MRSILGLFVLLLAACGQPATTAQIPTHAEQTVPANTVAVENGWAGPTPNGVDVSAGYLTITNGTAVADRLLAASSPRARAVQLHEMSMDSSQVMQMRDIGGIDVAPGATVALAPGGTHLMFTGVTAPFAEGEQIPVALTFEHAGIVNVTLDVRRGPPEHAGH